MLTQVQVLQTYGRIIMPKGFNLLMSICQNRQFWIKQIINWEEQKIQASLQNTRSETENIIYEDYNFHFKLNPSYKDYKFY